MPSGGQMPSRTGMKDGVTVHLVVRSKASLQHAFTSYAMICTNISFSLRRLALAVPPRQLVLTWVVPQLAAPQPLARQGHLRYSTFPAFTACFYIRELCLVPNQLPLFPPAGTPSASTGGPRTGLPMQGMFGGGSSVKLATRTHTHRSFYHLCLQTPPPPVPLHFQ